MYGRAIQIIFFNILGYVEYNIKVIQKSIYNTKISF